MTPTVDPARYLAYVGIAAVMVVTPGPANLFAIAIGAHHGRRAVLTAVAGMNLASMVWLGGAGLGLAALALAFPLAFRILAYVGAAYVAWMGIKALIGAWRGAGSGDHAATVHGRSAFRDGFTVQITNPKALVFTTVVLPPFLDAGRPMLPQVALFAATSLAMDMVAMTAYGFGGAALAARMSEPRFARDFAEFTGLLLIAAAALIAFRD